MGGHLAAGGHPVLPAAEFFVIVNSQLQEVQSREDYFAGVMIMLRYSIGP